MMEEDGNKLLNEGTPSDKETKEIIKGLQGAESDNTDNDEEDNDENPEKINDKEAESRFMLWYNEICNERIAMLESEEWYKRRIKELEKIDERQKQMIKQQKDNERKLRQRYAEAQLEIKLLRKKNQSTEDDHKFTESYKALALEQERLRKVDRENRETIKCLKKEIQYLRTRNDLKYAQRNKINKTEHTAITERVVRRTQITEVAGSRNGKPNCQVRTENVENHSLQSKTEIIETKFSTGRSSSKESDSGHERKKWGNVKEKVMTGKNDFKKKSPIPLPVIRTKSGYKVWRK